MAERFIESTAENRYREQRYLDQLQPLLEGCSDAVWVLDRNLLLRGWNGCGADLLGVDRVAHGLDVRQLLPQSAARLAAAHQAVLDERRPDHVKIDSNDGIVELVLFPFHDWVCAVAKSLAMQEQTSLTLLQTESRLQAVTDSAPLFVVEIGMDGGVTFCRGRGMSAAGIGSSSSWEGRRIFELIRDPESQKLVLSALDGETLSLDIPMSDGRIFEAFFMPRQDQDGAPAGALGVGIDVTDRRRAEAESNTLREELHQVQKLGNIGRLAGGIAHDFNNLMMVVLGHTQRALRQLENGTPQAPDRTVLSSLHAVRTAGERATALAGQLLTFTRKAYPQPRVIDLNPVVHDVGVMLLRVLGDNIQLDLQLATEPVWVFLDPARAQQVLLNLAVNARDAMPRGGRITIQTSLLPHGAAGLDADEIGTAVLAVRDDGEGIPYDAQQKIFEPFYTTKGNEGGTGLGLSTVHGIVKQAGGRIDLKSRLGDGTTFTILLPRVERGATESPVTPRPDGARKALGGRGTVLLVEDNEQVRWLTALELRDLGYKVLETASGEEAVGVAARHDGRIDLLLSDVSLPSMGGPQVYEAIAATRPDVPVLYMSGHSAEGTLELQEMEEGDPLLHKPFSTDELARRIRAIICH